MLKRLLIISLVKILSVSFFCTANAREIKDMYQACAQPSYYKIIVKNGLDVEFPVPIGLAELHLVPVGETYTVDVSKEVLDRFVFVLEKASVGFSFVENRDYKPKRIYWQTRDETPEHEKMAFNIQYCWPGSCDIQKHGVKNCAGYLYVEIINGNPKNAQELYNEAHSEGVPIVDMEFVEYAANNTAQM